MTVILDNIRVQNTILEYYLNLRETAVAFVNTFTFIIHGYLNGIDVMAKSIWWKAKSACGSSKSLRIYTFFFSKWPLTLVYLSYVLQHNKCKNIKLNNTTTKNENKTKNNNKRIKKKKKKKKKNEKEKL